MKVKQIILIAIAVILLGFAAVWGFRTCAKSAKHPYKIGVTVFNINDWRSVFKDDLVREAALNDGFEIDFRSAENDVSTQANDIKYFIDNNYDLIIIDPFRDSEVERAVTEASNASIPVIIYDRMLDTDDYTAYVTANNEDIGQRAADFINESLAAPAEIIEIKGWELSSSSAARHKGFEERLSSFPGYTIVGSAFTNWSEAEGRRIADSLLSAHPETKAVFAHSDRLALSVRHIADSLGFSPDLLILSVDGTPELGVKAVMDGQIDATFIYPTGSAEVLQTARKILHHEPFERNVVLPTALFLDSLGAHNVLLSNPSTLL